MEVKSTLVKALPATEGGRTGKKKLGADLANKLADDGSPDGIKKIPRSKPNEADNELKNTTSPLSFIERPKIPVNSKVSITSPVSANKLYVGGEPG